MTEHKLEWLGCRIFQAVLKIGNYVMGYHMPQYIEGAGAVRRLPEFVKRSKASKILVVTDKKLVEMGLLNQMFDALEHAGLSYIVHSDVKPNPTSDDVEAGFRLYREHGCNFLVAFGGGSPIDCAKAIGARAAHPKRSVAQMQGILRVLRPIPPMVAIPTTAGTGSETTVAAVITDSVTHRKAAINDPFLIPKYAILDPELTVGLPPQVTATTGMDALSHAVESYTNHTYHTRLENRLAKEAVKLIYDNLLTAYEDGANLQARQNMQKAAFYAGRTFTRGCVGYVHAVGHTLGGLYGVPHGLAMSVLLPHVMRQFGAKACKRLAELAEVCGFSGESDAEKAEAFLTWIEEINAKMGIPDRITCIREEDIEQMITWAKKEANPLYPTPEVWGRNDLRKLIDTVRGA